jgi:putative nucleotidyltransferase with HDIG domain
MPAVAQQPRELVLNRVREIPPLPLVVRELMSVMRKPESSADDITRVLSADQALAGKILRLVNSSFYGMPGHVSTISQAVVILGHAALRSLATTLSVVDSFGSELPAERRQVFWQHALATAAGAEVLARELGLPEPEEAFVAGLLHDIGHLILAIALPEECEAATAAGIIGDPEQERTIIGMDHCRAGRLVLQHWKLPNSLIECVRLHHGEGACLNATSPMLTVVALADRLSRLQGDTGESPAVTADVVALSTALRRDPAAIIGLLPTITARFDEARAVLGTADLDLDWTSESFGMFPPNGLPVVVLANDAKRAQWLERLAERHGYEPADPRQWLSEGPHRTPVLVICDVESISAEQMTRLEPLLANSGARVIVPQPGDPRRVPTSWRAQCGTLPMVFSVGELVL